MKKLIEEKLTTVIFYASILIFIISFNLAHNPPGGWYQQFIPSLPNLQISDMFFLDSLTGWAVTGNGTPNDTSGYILKTTNGGDDWVLKFTDFRDFSRVQFLNPSTGFVSGGYGTGARIYKSTDGGGNWFAVGIPGGGQIYISDMSILDEDTLWITSPNILVGGVFRTTNGGMNWQLQYSAGSNNPQKIYMYDSNFGFISTGVSNNGLRRTTDGGATWAEIHGVEGFTDLEFIDENTGWKTVKETERIRKTTNGGVNWTDIWLPPIGTIILDSRIKNLSVVNHDTIWGDYPIALYNNRLRGILYMSTNGGLEWGFQVPEDSIQSNVPAYEFLQFLNENTGWSYHLNRGVHTNSGGDTTIILSIKQLSNIIPEDFQLYQNYPNPFNPVTKIKFDIQKAGNVKLVVYDILGKKLNTLVDEKLSAGSYEYSFEAGGLPSGVYFYSLVTDKVTITKKMLLIK